MFKQAFLEYLPQGLEYVSPKPHGSNWEHVNNTSIFTDTVSDHWETATFQEFPVDEKFEKTLFRSDLQNKCEK